MTKELFEALDAYFKAVIAEKIADSKGRGSLAPSRRTPPRRM